MEIINEYSITHTRNEAKNGEFGPNLDGMVEYKDWHIIGRKKGQTIAKASNGN